jgi:hypothetical protein
MINFTHLRLLSFTMGNPCNSNPVFDEVTAQDIITSLADPRAQIAEDADEKLDEVQNIKGLERWNKPTINIYRYLVRSFSSGKSGSRA